MITREEVIEVCNKLGLVEYQFNDLDDYRPWKFPNSIFKSAKDATIVVLTKNPDVEWGNRLYFYDKLMYSKKYGYSMESEDNFHAFRTCQGDDYAEIYNKHTFEKALINVMKKIKNTELDLKLQNISEDFE